MVDSDCLLIGITLRLRNTWGLKKQETDDQELRQHHYMANSGSLRALYSGVALSRLRDLILVVLNLLLDNPMILLPEFQELLFLNVLLREDLERFRVVEIVVQVQLVFLVFPLLLLKLFAFIFVLSLRILVVRTLAFLVAFLHKDILAIFAEFGDMLVDIFFLLPLLSSLDSDPIFVELLFSVIIGLKFITPVAAVRFDLVVGFFSVRQYIIVRLRKILVALIS